MRKTNVGLALAALIGNMMPLATQGALDSANARARAEIARVNHLGKMRSNRTGPGRVTVFTHSNYVNDRRRKWYGLGGKWP